MADLASLLGGSTAQDPPKFTDLQALIHSIVGLLGDTRLAQDWGASILSPLQALIHVEDSSAAIKLWALQSAKIRTDLFDRIRTVEESVRGVTDVSERHSLRSFFSGIVPPVEVVIRGLHFKPPISLPTLSWFNNTITHIVIDLGLKLPRTARAASFRKRFEDLVAQIRSMKPACDHTRRSPASCHGCRLYIHACHELSRLFSPDRYDALNRQQQQILNNVLDELAQTLESLAGSAVGYDLWYIWLPPIDKLISTIDPTGAWQASAPAAPLSVPTHAVEPSSSTTKYRQHAQPFRHWQPPGGGGSGSGTHNASLSHRLSLLSPRKLAIYDFE